VRANKSAPGIEGVTFQAIEKQEGKVNNCCMEEGACFVMKSIGKLLQKLCTGKTVCRV